MESIKQRKVAKIVLENLSEIFKREGANIFGRAFVTIVNIAVTPDLLIARVFLSVYNVKEKNAVIEKLTAEKNHLRKSLGNKIKHQMRRVPDLEFFIDESLDEVFKMEELFKNLRKTN